MGSKNRLWPCGGRRAKSDPAYVSPFRLFGKNKILRNKNAYVSDFVFRIQKRNGRESKTDFGPAEAIGRSQTRPVEVFDSLPFLSHYIRMLIFRNISIQIQLNFIFPKGPALLLTLLYLSQFSQVFVFHCLSTKVHQIGYTQWHSLLSMCYPGD